jgi:uncharacterized delta-60 repeat protein
MKISTRSFCLFIIISFLISSFTQNPPPGFSILEKNFHPDANGGVVAIASQLDGKILISGAFTTVDNVSYNHLARINSDGTLDTGFNIGEGFNDDVYQIAIQTDGKIVIGGNFTEVNGISRNRIARLNSDGSLDTSFTPGEGVDWWVLEIVVQLDGKILIGGSFSSVNGTPTGNIARLNTDGSLDTSFNPGLGTNNQVCDILLLPDGNIIIGGYFTLVNGTPKSYIAKLDSTGKLDTIFDISFLGESEIQSILRQPDGDILIGGNFTQVNGVNRKSIARLNPNGTLDTGFDPGDGIINDWSTGSVLSMAYQSNGQVIISGYFNKVNGVIQKGIARLNPDGSLDNNFPIGAGFNNGVKKILLLSDKYLLESGWFTNFDGFNRNRIAKIRLDKFIFAYASSTDIDEGSSINFQAYLANSEPISSCWDFGNGIRETNILSSTQIYLDNPSWSVNGVGVYTVTVAITDTAVDKLSSQIPIIVRNVPPKVEAGQDQIITTGTETTFTATIIDPGILDTHSIYWDFGDGITVTNKLVVTHSWSHRGTYRVIVNVWDNDGGSGSDSSVVTVVDKYYLPAIFYKL